MSDQLTCGACGFANEPERVYCHNCGAKLDRSLLPVVEVDQESESVEAARRRIRKMTNPGSGGFGQILKTLLTVVFWAAVVAAVNVAIRKPADVPENKNELPGRLIQSELMEATQSPAPRAIAFSEADVNGALKQSLRRAASGGEGTDIDRAFAIFRPGVAHVGLEQTLLGFPIYSGIDYRLGIQGGKFAPVLVGGSIGRLPIHPAAMQYLDFYFNKLWATMKREHDQLDRMQTITVQQGSIMLVTKGAGVR